MISIESWSRYMIPHIPEYTYAFKSHEALGSYTMLGIYIALGNV